MDLRSIDLGDEAGIRGMHRAFLAAHRHDRPDAPFWTEDEAVHLLHGDDPEERFVPFVAETDDGTVAGSGIVFVPLLDNLDKAYFTLSVVPTHRGRGIGDAMVEHVLGVAAAEARSLVVVQGHVPFGADETHPVHRFAARHGFAVGNSEVRRTLRLPVPEQTLLAWSEEARPHHEGYRLATYVDLVPTPLRPSFVQLLNLLAADAPTGDIDFEAGGMTVEVYEEQAARRIETGRTAIITVAVRDGETVAHSTLSVPPAETELPHLSQWGTLVRADHRGHRLGLAVKAANLRAVQRMHPERTLIHTSNSPANRPMVAINEKMGFRPVETNLEFVRKV